MLTFNLKKEWFEKIKSGEKTHEYREFTGYWYQRLKDILYSKVCFACGYPSKDDESKRLYAHIMDINIINGKNSDLKINENVFDIEFELCGKNDKGIFQRGLK